MSGVGPELSLPLSGAPCHVPPREGWSPLEKWVWQKIGSGRPADINEKLGADALPSCEDGWGPERQLSSEFLTDILLHDPWRSGNPRGVVHILGALVTDPIDLRWTDLPKVLWIDLSRFLAPVWLSGLHTDRDLSFRGSLFLHDLLLDFARIGGGIYLDNAKVIGQLGISSAHIQGSLYMNTNPGLPDGPAQFLEIGFRGTSIGGQLCLDGATLSGKLDLHGARIERDLLIREGANLVDVDLSGARIGEEAAFDGGTISGEMTMQETQIGNLIMRKGTFAREVYLQYTQIDIVDLSDAKLAGINFTGSRIKREIRLAWRAKPPRWGEGAKLNLYRASVGVIQDQRDAWPEKLELSGFTYDRFGELGSDAPIAERDSEWFEKWLARNETYTPEPYHQCAKVLREMGHPEMADDVLYAGRERDRKEAWRSGRKLRAAGLLSLQLLIGYGYGRRLLWRPLRCALFLLLCGALLPDAVAFLAPDLLGDRVAWCAEVGGTGGGSVCLDQQPFIWRLMFSLDMLLPIVELSHEHTAVQAGLDGIGYAWVVVQRLLGWAIALFVIAGLTGLTK